MSSSSLPTSQLYQWKCYGPCVGYRLGLAEVLLHGPHTSFRWNKGHRVKVTHHTYMTPLVVIKLYHSLVYGKGRRTWKLVPGKCPYCVESIDHLLLQSCSFTELTSKVIPLVCMIIHLQASQSMLSFFCAYGTFNYVAILHLDDIAIDIDIANEHTGSGGRLPKSFVPTLQWLSFAPYAQTQSIWRWD